MRQAQHRLLVDTPHRGLVEITRPVAAWGASTGVRDGWRITLHVVPGGEAKSATISEDEFPVIHPGE